MKYEKGFFVFKKKDMVVIKAEYVELRRKRIRKQQHNIETQYYVTTKS